jgi:hypothetical protein
MNDFHLKSPLWLGDRKTMHVGIARFRLVDDMGKPKKGNIRIWIDYKVQDKNDPLNPNRLVLAYKYPFIISCAKALEYPTQILNDFKRTTLHIIPIEDLKVQKTRRCRTMPQDEFKNLIEHAREVRARQNQQQVVE